MPDAAANWFGLYTEPQGEFRATAGLQRVHIECWLPVMVVCRRVRGRPVERQAPLMARYLFVRLPRWRLSETRAVIGVQEILPHEHEPQPIPAREIESLQQRQANGEFVFRSTASDRRRRKKILRALAELACMRQ